MEAHKGNPTAETEGERQRGIARGIGDLAKRGEKYCAGAEVPWEQP